MDAHVPSLDRKRDEVRRLSVVHLDRAAEAARERRRHELVDVALGRAPRGPPATRIVVRSEGTPDRSSSSIATASAAERGSNRVPGIGCAVGSITTVARPRRGTRLSSGSPASGKRSESRTAPATSATGSRGGGGASTTASSPALTTAILEPARSGMRVGERPVQPEKRAPEARFGQNRDASRFVIRQSVVIVG